MSVDSADASVPKAAAGPRVLILVSSFHPNIGGVESNAKRLALYLSSRGTPVQVLTKRVSARLPDRDRIANVPIRRIGPFGETSPGAKWLMSPAAFWWLLRHPSEYDVVCVIDCRGVGVPAIAARWLTGRPVLLQGQTIGVLAGTVEDPTIPWEGITTRTLKWAPRALYRRADAFACISHVLEREARGCGLPADRVHFLPNAINMSRFRPPTHEERAIRRQALGAGPDDTVCVFVGRLSTEKGVGDLLEAWSLLRPERALLLIAGPDMVDNPWNAGPAARAFVERHGLTRSARFLGPSSDVVSILQAADVAVQPSHFEALGLSAVEALACGVPVVATGVGGLLDFVTDGVNGRLVPPRDPRALASALETLLLDSNLRGRLAQAARPSVEQYDERVVFAQMADLLASLTAAGRH